MDASSIMGGYGGASSVESNKGRHRSVIVDDAQNGESKSSNLSKNRSF
jgi:hypothetical protein